MARTRHFSCWGPGSIPGQGTEIPQAAQCGQKKKKERDSISGVFPGDGGLPFDSAVELPTGFPQLSLSPHRPSSPWGLPLGASRPKYPRALSGSLARGPVVIFTPVLITVPVEGKKNVT